MMLDKYSYSDHAADSTAWIQNITLLYKFTKRMHQISAYLEDTLKKDCCLINNVDSNATSDQSVLETVLKPVQIIVERTKGFINLVEAVFEFRNIQSEHINSKDFNPDVIVGNFKSDKKDVEDNEVDATITASGHDIDLDTQYSVDDNVIYPNCDLPLFLRIKPSMSSDLSRLDAASTKAIIELDAERHRINSIITGPECSLPHCRASGTSDAFYLSSGDIKTNCRTNPSGSDGGTFVSGFIRQTPLVYISQSKSNGYHLRVSKKHRPSIYRFVEDKELSRKWGIEILPLPSKKDTLFTTSQVKISISEFFLFV